LLRRTACLFSIGLGASSDAALCYELLHYSADLNCVGHLSANAEHQGYHVDWFLVAISGLLRALAFWDSTSAAFAVVEA